MGGLAAPAAAVAVSIALAAAALAAAGMHAPAHAAQEAGIAVRASQETYYYGDRLTFTLEVPEVAGGPAALYIRDEAGKSSSPILFEVEGASTTLTSPFPFESLVYPTGTYTLRVLYAGGEAATTFRLEDSGRVVIPSWIRDVAVLWTDGEISDGTFAGAVRYLVGAGIISLPPAEGGEGEAPGAVIPQWVKTSTRWWADGLITDGEFAEGLRYLMSAGIVAVGR